MEGRGGQLGSVVRRLSRRQIVGERRSGQPGGALSLSLDFIQWQINGRLARGRAKSSRINWPTKVYDLMMYRDAALIAIKIAPMDADYWRFRVHWCLYPRHAQQPRTARGGLRSFSFTFKPGLNIHG